MRITNHGVSVICILTAVACVVPRTSYCVSSRVRQLLEEKQQKMDVLEKCEGKRKGFMIAGISTIGLTGVGVVGNVALANANKRAENELASKKQTLADKKLELAKKKSTSANTGKCRWQDTGVENADYYYEDGGKYLVCGSREDDCSVGTIVYLSYLLQCSKDGWIDMEDAVGDLSNVPDCNSDLEYIRTTYEDSYHIEPNKTILATKSKHNKTNPVVDDACKIEIKGDVAQKLKDCEDSGGQFGPFNNKMCYCGSNDDLQNEDNYNCECVEEGKQWDKGSKECVSKETAFVSQTPEVEEVVSEEMVVVSPVQEEVVSEEPVVASGSGGFNCRYQETNVEGRSLSYRGKYLVCGSHGKDGCDKGTIVKSGMYLYLCGDDSNWTEYQGPDCTGELTEIVQNYPYHTVNYPFMIFMKQSVADDEYSPVVTEAVCKVNDNDLKGNEALCTNSGGGFLWNEEDKPCHCSTYSELQNKTAYECECVDDDKHWDKFAQKCV